ncbi:MAG: hypothetical protein Q7K45_05135 [Nanoarchaeota archaeon]|nr:hypothetical protein [Nanoarchaeota archaeon]
MELIDRIGGLGKIKVTPEENGKIKQLWELVVSEGKKCFLNENCEHAPAYDALMKDFFPAYQRVNGEVPRRAGFRDNNPFYQGVGKYTDITIRNRLPLSRVMGHQDVCLEIIHSSFRAENEYFMTVTLDSTYKPDCVDDIVSILGTRETPSITEVQLMPLPPDYSSTQYGIADVPRLGTVLELYQRATALAGRSNQIVHASSEQLNLLRKDAKEHENLFVREGSATKYHKLLEALTNQ